MSEGLASAELLCVDETVTVVVLGEFDVATADLLADALRSACDRRPTHVWVDLAGARFFGLTALELVLDARQELGEQGCPLHIVHTTPSMDKMLAVLGLDDLYPETRPASVASVGGPRLALVPDQNPDVSQHRSVTTVISLPPAAIRHLT